MSAIKRSTKAMKAFWRGGYSATSMRLLLAATGLAAKSLYRDLGGKDELFVEALDRYIAIQDGLYAESLGTAPLGIERIRSHLRSYRFTRQFQGVRPGPGDRWQVTAPARAAAGSRRCAARRDRER